MLGTVRPPLLRALSIWARSGVGIKGGSHHEAQGSALGSEGTFA